MTAPSTKDLRWSFKILVGVASLIAATARAGAAFDLSAQPLADALRAVARQTKCNILFDRKLTTGLRAAPLKADLSTEEALGQLLAGTGLTYRASDERTFVIVVAATAARETATFATRTQADSEAQSGHGHGGGAQRRSNGAQRKSGSDFSEVTIAATRGNESSQSMPAAITAITSQRLDELNATSSQDYFRDVPGLSMDLDGDGHLDFSLRGTPSAIPGIPATSAPVAQYIDEIPLTAVQPQIDMRLADVERIEVSRGPQGTLDGQSALSGAIRIVTRKPDASRFSASGEARISKTSRGGDSDQGSLMLNVPLVQNKLALRANYFRAGEAGYIDLVSTPSMNDPRILRVLKENANASHSEGGRLTALFAPTDSLTIRAEAITANSRTAMSSPYQPRLGDLVAAVACDATRPVSKCYYRTQNQNADLYNLTANVDAGWASLVSSSSWTRTEHNEIQVPVEAGAFVPRPDVRMSGEAFTQELRLSSSTGPSRQWGYRAGAFYSRSRSGNLGQAAVGGTAIPVAAENNEAAIFGEVSYRAGAHWTTRMGIRQADLRQEQRAGRIVGALPPLDGGEANFEMVEHNTNYHPVSGRAVLEYAFDSDALVYGSVSNGFRRGGINIPSPFEHLEIPTFYAPDESMNYEIGWKLAFPGLNATVNGAVYRIDWNHVQTLFLTDTYPGANYYGNGSNAFINGFELEGTLEPIRALALRGSFALADARLADDQVLLKDPLILHGQRGDRLPFVPRVSGSLSLSYRHSLGASAFHGFAILNAQCQGKRTTDYSGGLRGYPGPTGRNYAVMKSYCASQAQLGIGADRFRGAVYVDNLLDQRAQIMLFPSDTGVGQITIRPRTLGLFLRYSFD